LTLGIIGQQISRLAARAVFERLLERLGGGALEPALVAGLSPDELRAIGFSYAKAAAVLELAQRVVSGEFVFAELESLPDDEAISRLVGLRGVGPWSAQVFLLRTLRRPDVFPAGDMGLRRALVRLDDLDDLPSVPSAEDRAVAWRPWRSYAARYLWLSYSVT
jgi:DNA-3-methyladenine glycosylase II